MENLAVDPVGGQSGGSSSGSLRPGTRRRSLRHGRRTPDEKHKKRSDKRSRTSPPAPPSVQTAASEPEC